jgi:hypothetical protein
MVYRDAPNLFRLTKPAPAHPGHRHGFSVQTEFHSEVPPHLMLDKHAGIGHKEQLFTGFQAANHNRMLEGRVRFGYFEAT